jgi:hypothetical protein
METRCPASTLFAHYLEDTHELLKSNLKKAKAEMMARHNTLRLTKDGKETAVARYGMQHPEYKIGDEVLLDTRNMPRAKLDARKAGPFKISWVGRSACKLEGLPEGYHPTFHVSLLEPYHRGPEAPPPIELPPLPNGQGHYTPEKIIEHGIDDDNKDLFLVVWKDYPLEEATWEPYESLVPGAEEVLAKFYTRHKKVKTHINWSKDYANSKKRHQPQIGTRVSKRRKNN